MTRPQLPVKYANPKVKRIVEQQPPPQVKYQMLNCQGKEILVGRLKVETPTENGHAFILRRFDTGAISLTTMFRAAFPLASEETERAELQWVKDNHDLSGNNGSNRESHITRLAGTWVGPALATELADQYAIAPLINIVVNAQPDPKANYKRSAKAAAPSSAGTEMSQHTIVGVTQHISSASITANAGSMTFTTSTSRTSPVSNRATLGSLPNPSPNSNQPNPPKRRKESSPVPQSADLSPAKTSLRRSHRTKSPPAKSVSNLTSTPARSSKKHAEQTTPSSDKTAVDDEGDKVEEVAAKELHDQDIREQKELIQDLKAKRAVEGRGREEQARAEEESQAMEETAVEGEPLTSNLKRPREETEPEYKFEFKEPEVGEREIATNRRVGFRMEPRTRSFAWGVAAFAVGMGAVSLIPSFL